MSDGQIPLDEPRPQSYALVLRYQNYREGDDADDVDPATLPIGSVFTGRPLLSDHKEEMPDGLYLRTEDHIVGLKEPFTVKPIDLEGKFGGVRAIRNYFPANVTVTQHRLKWEGVSRVPVRYFG